MPEKRRPKDSVAHTMTVAVLVSLACSVLVSTAAILLQPRQEQNQERYRQRIVLEVAGLYEPGMDVAEGFAQIEPRLVDLETGEYLDAPDPGGFDFLAAAGDPQLGLRLPEEQDIAGIQRRARTMPVYLVRSNGEVDQVILPVYGKGLWSTLYGYLALDGDGTTVRGLRFYEHAETPGLGDQIDKDAWRDQWFEKRLFDETGALRIEIVRGKVPPGPDAVYQVDGLSGATMTARGVMHLVRYWAGAHGYGPYLEKLKEQADDDS